MPGDNNTGDPAANIDPAATSEGGNLPSSQVDFDKFNVSEDFLTENAKDGRLMGRYENFPDMMKAFQELEGKHTNLVRENKNNETQQTQEQIDAANIATAKQARQTAVVELIPEFMAANMVLTPDIEAKATEAGIDVRDLKLGAIELRDRVTLAHNVVGGQEEYSNMIAWGKENMSEAQMASFDKDVSGGMSEYAIKGLHADYKAAGGVAPTRITGSNSGTSSVKGYATRAEMFSDREYLNTRNGANDKSARDLHNRRMDLTSDSVIYNR